MKGDVQEVHTTSITTPSDTEIRIERVFDAPRELVWEVYTDPELMPEWLGPRGRRMSIQEMDIRPGGRYRYTFPGADGEDYVFFGEYLEVVPPELLVATFEFEVVACNPSVDRLELEELEGGRTRLVATSTFASREERDGKLQSGMERGVREGYDKLGELLRRLRSRS